MVPLSLNATIHSTARSTECVGPELLAPAGNWECARAAVENGADAIYFGLEQFNARMRADNFTVADLPPLMDFLHRRGVRGYVTFNTLVFADEMEAAAGHLRAIITAGVDAAIVQDIGVCRLIRTLSPDFPIHASTQMTITSAAGVEFARELGCNLVVLARECSIREIEAIRSHFASERPGGTNPTAGLPLETFVHGALCVAYSGQCLTSESLGGRSANRGECAQACRMPYELFSDGRQVELGERRYLLSPQDLAGLELLPALVRAGVASLKIEGRLKSPEYVANVTRVYRRTLDRLFAGARSQSPPPAENGTQDRYDLEMAFSRGLFTGWLAGIDNQRLVHARFGKKRGVFLGEVTAARGRSVEVRLLAPLKPGDGVVFDSGTPDQPEEGGRVFAVREQGSGDTHVLSFGDNVDVPRIQVGDKVWKTSDPDLDRRLRRSFTGPQPRHRRALSMVARGTAGSPLEVSAQHEHGLTVTVISQIPLAVAQRHPLDEATLSTQLGRLGGTAYRLGSLSAELSGPVILPLAELNRLRREIVAQLDQRLAAPRRWTLHPADGVDHLLSRAATGGVPPPATAELIVLVRTLPQLEAALRANMRILYCEFENPKRYREAVQLVRESGTALVLVAPPRIFKPGEDWILSQVRSSEADGYLVRNYDHLRYFAGQVCVGDFSLNVANPLTAAYFQQHFALTRLTASYDLNATQLEALLRTAPAEWFEITLHQHMPMFHMEHCVFCAFLSAGKDYRDCGRPCDRHEVRLRDRVGAMHPLKADAGCRNTVFNARAQTGAEYARRFMELGARHFRIEFLDESPEQVAATIAKYRQLLRGEISGRDLWKDLQLSHQLGVTRGPMEERAAFQT